MDNLKAYLSLVFLSVFFLSSHVLAHHELPQEMENNDEDGGAVLWHRKMMKPSKTETKSFKVSSAEPPIIDPRGAKEGSYYGHLLRAEPPIDDGEEAHISKAGGYYGNLFRAEPPEDDGDDGVHSSKAGGYYGNLFRAEPPEGLKLGHVHASSAEPLVDPRGAKEGYYGHLFRAEPPDEDPRDAKERRVKGKSVVHSRGDVDDEEPEVTYGYSTFRADSPPDDSKVSYGVLNMNDKVDKETKN